MDDTAATPDIDPTAPPAGEAAPVAPPTPAAPATPWEGPSPDVVAWLLVNWHNKHPLARRLGIADIHTVGAVALPFMAQALPKEPSLEGGAPTEPPPPPARRRLPWQRKVAGSGPRPAWIEEFIPGLKTAAVATMALDNGFTTAPDDLPLRRVDIDERALAADANQPGAWPMELVLLSAAFDAGSARRRVLVGRRDQVLGQRALDPARLGVVGSIAALVLIAAVWVMWPSSKPSKEALAALAAAEAASAASAAQAASATALAEQAARSAQAASAASAPASAAAATDPASAASAAASAATTAESPPASAPVIAIPNIRPSLHASTEAVPREKEPAPTAPSTSTSTSTTGTTASTGPAKPGAPASEAERRVSVDDTGLGSLMKRDGAAPGAKLVALVSQPHKTKADAEAQLARMREMIGATLGGNTVPNGEVFQTKDGWRAAVWPFGSREEAQLINATLLARGIRGTRAVDF
ncbi:hypothetical protein [Mitsuaria sp. 7]|uniref:hypothetical protein n=1 Tax=Mitsuaria sp. 7 TaxID=1658665 RepID=UPI0018D3627C|nr:hypothetical protein [Mitsuaria sp. 7]